MQPEGSADPYDPRPAGRPLSVAAAAAVLATIVAGGYMAGTQNYGRADYRLGDGAHHACGKQFPTCNGDFMPFGKAELVDIHLTHRAFMYLATLLVLALVVGTLRRRPGAAAVRLAWTLAGLLVLQLLVGALNVWLDEYELLILLHLTLGTLLWTASLGLTLELYRAGSGAPAGARASEGRDGLMEAAAATSWRTIVSDYVEMTKPKVQSLLLFTTVTTMYVAGDPSIGWCSPAAAGGAGRDQPRGATSTG